MSAFDHDSFMPAWRRVRDADGSRIAQAEYDLVMAAIRGEWRSNSAAGARPETPPSASAPKDRDPPWVTVARGLIGLREIEGPANAPLIAKGWARLGAPWFNDDETPWCGLFVAHCLEAAGLPYPGKGMFARAKAWLDWGKVSPPVHGAVAVFGRAGGGHVGFLVGESRTNLYVLGGNQGNMVSIAPVARSRALGFRWPASLPASQVQLARMEGGVISRNEA